MKLLDATVDDLRGVMKEQSDQAADLRLRQPKQSLEHRHAESDASSQATDAKQHPSPNKLVSSKLLRTGAGSRRR